VKRCRDTVCIYDGRSNSLDLKFQRTLRVPEDGKFYPLPAYFGLYPLFNVETFSDRLPLYMQKKGGLFIPMFQREALSLDFDCSTREECFAIRIYVGSINAISGKAAQSRLSEGEQDYIIVPNQRRLDGFLAGKGKVRQFVAMPLGSGYSVEKQVTGSEFIGGIQLEIIPRLSDKVKFIRPQHNTVELPWLPQQLDISEDIFLTPRELGMTPGQRLLMQDVMGQKIRRMEFDLGFLGNNGTGNSRRQNILPIHEKICRPTFVHDMFLGTGQHTYSTNESLVLCPVEPLSLQVDWQAIMRSPKGTTFEEYSPFLDISDLKNHISSIKQEFESRPRCVGHLLFNGTIHKGPPIKYSPLAEYTHDKGIISFKEDVRLLESRLGSSQAADPDRPSDPIWEMALGAGGNLGQSIEKTKDKRLWDWGASKLFNIQILNSVAFKEFTGISPVTPISFREYVTAKIPFYSFLSVSNDSMIGDHTTTFKSIGQLDHSAIIPIGIHVNRSGTPIGCASCENNICDSMYVFLFLLPLGMALSFIQQCKSTQLMIFSSLQPCKHIFCSDCIKFTMVTDTSITCAFCSGSVSETITFSAPMEMPFSPPEVQLGLKAIEPLIPYRAEDTIRENRSSLIEKREKIDKSTSNIVENLIVVLSEMVKNEVSPEDTSHGISDLVAGSIARSASSVLHFDTAIRNLTQTSIDIRIPIFKVALPKAIQFATLYHVKQLLLLIPSIDDLDDHNKEFVSAAINATRGDELFTILFQWIMDGRRSIEDFGLSVGKLFVLVRSDDAIDILAKFVAGRKKTRKMGL
jgi:hypothetical protein